MIPRTNEAVVRVSFKGQSFASVLPITNDCSVRACSTPKFSITFRAPAYSSGRGFGPTGTRIVTVASINSLGSDATVTTFVVTSFVLLLFLAIGN